MKKFIKLAAFDILFVIIAIFGFSKRGLGLSFNPRDGTFAFAVSLTIFGVGVFLLVNYFTLISKEQVDYNIKNLSSITDCIKELEKCKRTDPVFAEEIKEAIGQLQTLERRTSSLSTLLEQSGVSKDYANIDKTANKAQFFVFENVKRIILRLIAFDNEEYIARGQRDDISVHKNYVRNILTDNDNILREYQNMLLAVSNIGNTHKTNLADLQCLTEALNIVLGGEQFASLAEKYKDTHEGGTAYEELH